MKDLIKTAFESLTQQERDLIVRGLIITHFNIRLFHQDDNVKQMQSALDKLEEIMSKMQSRLVCDIAEEISQITN